MPEDPVTQDEVVYFSSKKAEEVGFEKFARRQAQLQGIHVLVLDHMRIRGGLSGEDSETIGRICAHVTDLDLSSNLFESLDQVLQLIAHFPKLSSLTLDGNRVSVNTGAAIARQFNNIKSIGLSETYFSWSELAHATRSFPGLLSLSAERNGFSYLDSQELPPNLRHLVLSDNPFAALTDTAALDKCPHIESVTLKRCSIRSMTTSCEGPLSQTIHSIDLSFNEISSWSFFNTLPEFYPRLRHLQVSGNPLYANLTSAEGKPLTPEDGYMLTIARLPELESLNYSKITEKERLNAETYYLGQIAAELSHADPEQRDEVLRKHPRWRPLCEEYGEPAIRQSPRVDEIDPNSLAARLVCFTFVLDPAVTPQYRTRTWLEEVPKSFNIYSLLGIVGKRLGIVPLQLRLVWETGERDPVGKDRGYTGPEWWDSSDEEEDDELRNSDAFVAREVELVAGTRPIGTYFEGREARVRVELKYR